MPLRRRWFRVIVRGGYIARGVTYFLVGYLALLAARGPKEAENTPGALIELVSAPAGRALLLVMASGLFAFGLWRTCQASGIEALAHSNWRETNRLTYAASAFVYFVLALTAVSPLLGWRVPSGERQTIRWTEWLLNKSFGVGLVSAIGILVASVGLYWCISAFVKNPMPSLNLSKKHSYWIRPLCWVGLMSWGTTLGLTGTFFVLAALYRNPSVAGGFEGTLTMIQRQPFGRWVLTVVAFGLAAFGIFSIVEGFFRRIGENEQLFD